MCLINALSLVTGEHLSCFNWPLLPLLQNESGGSSDNGTDHLL